MIVASAVIGIDAGGLDRDADRRVLSRVLVQGDGAFEIGESAPHFGQQVPDLKAYLGMVLVDPLDFGGRGWQNAGRGGDKENGQFAGHEKWLLRSFHFRSASAWLENARRRWVFTWRLANWSRGRSTLD